MINHVSTRVHATQQLEDLQRRFHSYPVTWLPATFLRLYYRAMTELARSIDTTGLDLWYVRSNVRLPPPGHTATWAEAGEEVGNRSPYERVQHLLDLHMARIGGQDYESHQQANFLTCAWLTLLREGRTSCEISQRELQTQLVARFSLPIRYGGTKELQATSRIKNRWCNGSVLAEVVHSQEN